MAAQPADPFAALPWLQRVGLRRRLNRAWRQGVAQQRAVLLAHLRTGLSGVAVVAAEHHGSISELTYADGTIVRLWLAHRPAVRSLRLAVREGAVVLAQVDDHGHCWALYFASLEGRLPLICRDLRVRTAQGGSSTPAPPSAPAPDHRRPLSV